MGGARENSGTGDRCHDNDKGWTDGVQLMMNNYARLFC